MGHTLQTHKHTHSPVILICQIIPSLSHYKPTLLFGRVLRCYYPKLTLHLTIIRLKTRKIFVKHCEIDLKTHPCFSDHYHFSFGGDLTAQKYIQYRHLIHAPVNRTSASVWLLKYPLKTCQTQVKHINATRSLRIKATFSCEVIHTSMTKKLGYNRTYGRVLCSGCPRI